MTKEELVPEDKLVFSWGCIGSAVVSLVSVPFLSLTCRSVSGLYSSSSCSGASVKISSRTFSSPSEKRKDDEYFSHISNNKHVNTKRDPTILINWSSFTSPYMSRLLTICDVAVASNCCSVIPHFCLGFVWTEQ